jgi:hypothetical protein
MLLHDVASICVDRLGIPQTTITLNHTHGLTEQPVTFFTDWHFGILAFGEMSQHHLQRRQNASQIGILAKLLPYSPNANRFNGIWSKYNCRVDVAWSCFKVGLRCHLHYPTVLN